MIYTVTLNPSYDKTYHLTDFLLGSTNRAEPACTKPGGKGLNVSRVLNTLGIPNLALGIADIEFCNALTEIEHDFIISGNPVRMNIKIHDASHGNVTELNEMGSEVSSELLDRVKDRLDKYLSAGDIVVLTGSLPPGAPCDIYRTWIELCHSKSALPVLDTSGEALKEGIKAKPVMIKPNIDELCFLAGRSLSGQSDRSCIISEAAKFRASGIKYVLVSMGKDGAILVSGNGVFEKSAPLVEVKSTVGAGDAMLAAFIYGTLEGLNDEELVNFAVEAGSKACIE